MKKALLMMTACILVIAVDAQKSVDITYLANDGFLITSGTEKILIDALFDKSFGRYDVPSGQLRAEITSGSAPFNDIDLYLLTHRDGDHFFAPYVIEFLKKHPETQFISPGQLKESLAGEAGIKKQLTFISSKVGEMIDTTIGSISLKIYRVKHLGDSLGNLSANLAFLIKCGDFKILHIGDGPFDFDKKSWEKFHLEKEKIDILFLEYFGQSDAKRQFIHEVIHPKYIIAQHIPPSDMETEAKKFLEVYPKATIFKSAMERKTFNE